MSKIGGKPGKKQTGGAAADLPAGKKATQAAYPFCSVRCADIDLDRWLSGRYRVAGSADDDDAPSTGNPLAGDAPDND
jgi:endogenous inhibitor of DNA gyrase (YacG/DUF329 family)